MKDTKIIADGIVGFLEDGEGALLFELARDVNRGVIVEVGSFRGKSTVYLARGALAGSRAHVYAIDPQIGINADPEDFRKNLALAGVAPER